MSHQINVRVSDQDLDNLRQLALEQRFASISALLRELIRRELTRVNVSQTMDKLTANASN